MKYGMADSISDEDIKSAYELQVQEKVKETIRSRSPILVAMSSKSIIDTNAVVFSIQFYGKTIGEVGLMDPDLSELDWKKFKEYLFQNLLSMQNQDNISVMYSDEEGDKLPIECDEEYQEALKVAKRKAVSNEKLVLDISRQGRLPTTVLNLASSAIKRVSSSPPKDGGGISFFKHSTSPPKENRSSLSSRSIGTERKLFPEFFLHTKGPIPGHVQGLWEGDCDEALEFNKTTASTTTTTTTKSTTSTAASVASAPQGIKGIFHHKDFSSSCINESPSHSLPEHCKKSFSSSVRQKTFPYTTEGPPPWFITYMENFRSSLTEEVVEKICTRLENQHYVPQQEQKPKVTCDQILSVLKLKEHNDEYILQRRKTDDTKEENTLEGCRLEYNDTNDKIESNTQKDKTTMRKKKDKYEKSESSHAKRKKLAYEEEKLTRKLE